MTFGKKFGLIILIIFASLSFLFFRAMVRFGEFTTLTSRFDGKCESVANNVSGVEDIQAFKFVTTEGEKKLIAFSAYDRNAAKKNPNLRGALYISPIDNIQAISDATNIIDGDNIIQSPKDFKPFGIGVLNGPKPIIMAVNNASGNSSVEIYEIDENGLLNHINSVKIDGAHRLNDVVPLSASSFYVTNESDYASNSFVNFVQNLLDNDKTGSIFYYDGKNAQKIPANISFANSIALSNDGSKLYLTGTISRNLQIYSRNIANNQLNLIDNVFLGTGVDNISIDDENRIFIAAHPKLFTIQSRMWFGGKDTPNQMIVIEPNGDNKGGNVDQVYIDKGENGFGATSIGIKNNDKLIMGSLYSKGIRFCQLPQEWHQSKSHPAQQLIDVDRDAKIKKQRELDIKKDISH